MFKCSLFVLSYLIREINFLMKIFNDPLKINAKPKIDALKYDYVKPGGQVKVILVLTEAKRSFFRF